MTYDRKHHQPEVFAIGAVVLKKDVTRKERKGGKLDTKWTGPYKVAKSLGRGLYRLEDVSNPTKIITRVNGVHLKPYHQPPEVLILVFGYIILCMQLISFSNCRLIVKVHRKIHHLQDGFQQHPTY